MSSSKLGTNTAETARFKGCADGEAAATVVLICCCCGEADEGVIVATVGVANDFVGWAAAEGTALIFCRFSCASSSVAEGATGVEAGSGFRLTGSAAEEAAAGERDCAAAAFALNFCWFLFRSS